MTIGGQHLFHFAQQTSSIYAMYIIHRKQIISSKLAIKFKLDTFYHIVII